MEVKHVHRYFVHLDITLLDGLRGEMMEVYASPKASRRNMIWGVLDRMCVEKPWILIGDFNCVLKVVERSSKSGPSSSFVEWVDRRGLIVLGYSSPKYTWQHGISSHTRWEARLDRTLSNAEWRSCFHSASILHLPHAYSNQCLLLLSLKTEIGSRLGNRPLRFLLAWFRHEEFFSWTNTEWQCEGDLGLALKVFVKKLKAWNRDTFGNIFRRKKMVLLRHGGVQ